MIHIKINMLIIYEILLSTVRKIKSVYNKDIMSEENFFQYFLIIY